MYRNKFHSRTSPQTEHTLLNSLSTTKIMPAIHDAINRNNGTTQIASPTGTGKTLSSLLCAPLLISADTTRVFFGLPTIMATNGAYTITQTKSQNPDMFGMMADGISFNPHAPILAMTYNIMLSKIISMTPEERAKTVFYVDEAHDKSAPILLKILNYFRTKREKLQIVLMTATPPSFDEYRFLVPTNVFDSETSHHVVHTHFLEEGNDVYSREDMIKFTTSPNVIIASLLELILHAIKEKPGDVLVFIPSESWGDALKVSLIAPNIEVHVLSSNSGNHDIILSGNMNPRIRRIILATNIAESSITIPGISIVIDTGLTNSLKTTSKGKGILEIGFTSHGEMTQRKGRCGRLYDGDYYAMMSKSLYDSMLPHPIIKLQAEEEQYYALKLIAAKLPADIILGITERKYNGMLDYFKSIELVDTAGDITSYGMEVLQLRINSIMLALFFVESIRLIDPVERLLFTIIAALIQAKETSPNCFFFDPAKINSIRSTCKEPDMIPMGVLKKLYMREHHRDYMHGESDLLGLVGRAIDFIMALDGSKKLSDYCKEQSLTLKFWHEFETTFNKIVRSTIKSADFKSCPYTQLKERLENPFSQAGKELILRYNMVYTENDSGDRVTYKLEGDDSPVCSLDSISLCNQEPRDLVAFSNSIIYCFNKKENKWYDLHLLSLFIPMSLLSVD